MVPVCSVLSMLVMKLAVCYIPFFFPSLSFLPSFFLSFLRLILFYFFKSYFEYLIKF